MYRYIAIIESDDTWYDLFSNIIGLENIEDVDLVDWYEVDNGNK